MAWLIFVALVLGGCAYAGSVTCGDETVKGETKMVEFANGSVKVTAEGGSCSSAQAIRGEMP